jgi:hypothetical protein
MHSSTEIDCWFTNNKLHSMYFESMTLWGSFFLPLGWNLYPLLCQNMRRSGPLDQHFFKELELYFGSSSDRTGNLTAFILLVNIWLLGIIIVIKSQLFCYSFPFIFPPFFYLNLPHQENSNATSKIFFNRGVNWVDIRLRILKKKSKINHLHLNINY